MRRPGTRLSNAIPLVGAKKLVNGSTVGYPDTRLSGCADPADFNNKTFGDGADIVSVGLFLRRSGSPWPDVTSSALKDRLPVTLWALCRQRHHSSIRCP